MTVLIISLYKCIFKCHMVCIGGGNGNPPQYSCLENPRDGGAWWAAFYGVAQSRTRLKQLSSSSSIPPWFHGVVVGEMAVLVHNKVPWTRWLINNRKLFLTVLEAGSPVLGCRHMVRFWWQHSSRLQTANIWYPHRMESQWASSLASF